MRKDRFCVCACNGARPLYLAPNRWSGVGVWVCDFPC
jgi:hypothetical protein